MTPRTPSQGGWDRIAILARDELVAFNAGKAMSSIQVRLAHDLVKVSNQIQATVANTELSDEQKRARIYALGTQQKMLSQPFITNLHRDGQQAEVLAKGAALSDQLRARGLDTSAIDARLAAINPSFAASREAALAPAASTPTLGRSARI